MYFTLQPIRPSKELILSKVSEETLMEHYLGIPVKKGLFKSPLRKDNRPTCSYFRNKNGNLLFKDFGTSFTGDFVSVVMCKFNCSYGKALGIIANDFGIITRPKLKVNEPLIEYTNNKLDIAQDAVIQVEIKDFDEYELK
jgi:hypothetical protein